MSTQTSNALFFAVRDSPALQNGWVVKVKDSAGGTYTRTLAVFNEWVEFSIGPQINDSGAGSVTLDLDSPFWKTTLPNDEPANYLRAYECLWEAYEDGILRFQWVGENIEESFLNTTGTRAATISGPGTASMLEWGAVLRPGFPLPIPEGLDKEANEGYSGTNNVPTYIWGFDQKWPAMRMWWTLYNAAKSRGCFTWFSLLFTETTDSGGAAWEYIPIVLTEEKDAFQPQLGVSVREFLDECTGQDTSKNFAMWADWFVWPGFKLDVRKTIGSHREHEVVFFEGNTITKSRSRLRSEIRNVIVVRDVKLNESVAADAASIAKWGRREAYSEATQNVTDAPRRNAMAGIYLEQRKDEKSQWTIEVPAQLPGRKPFIDYDIGDWIGISTFQPDGTSVVDAYRVMAITVQVDSNGYARVELTLQSILENRQKQLERELTRLTNNVNEVADDPLANVADPEDSDSSSTLVRNPDGSYNWDSGTGSGYKVWLQTEDPGYKASIGDFWYGADYTSDQTDLPYSPDDEPETELVDKWEYKHAILDQNT